MNSTLTKESSQILKGLAILAVVVLHIFSTMPSSWYFVPGYHQLWIIIDQISRFCVPMFVALSGFAFMKKYGEGVFSFSEFFQKRILKLLPLYILWSVLYYVILPLDPAWNTWNPLTLFQQLIFGRAYYHLYFVPLIFQLYLLFPVLRLWVKKHWQSAIVISMGVQITLYWYYSLAAAGKIIPPVLLNDQREYLFFASWIGYFVLGMVLAIPKKEIKIHLPSQIFWLVALGGLLLSCLQGMSSLQPWVNGIMALRFTRLPILLYATSLIIAVTMQQKIQIPLRTLCARLGKYSYLIYLAHPLLLRIFFGAYLANVSTQVLVIASVAFVAAGAVSVKFFRWLS